MPRLDSYVWRARVAPAIIATAPLLAFVAFVVEAPVAGVLTSAVGAGAAAIAAIELTRSRGIAIEERLVERWGGLPTTLALRNTGNETTLRTRRRRAIEVLSEITLPSAAEEIMDSENSDRVIAHAVRIAMAKIRSGSTDSAVLASENASYGFRRNSRGIKPIALAVLAGATVAGALGGYLTSQWIVGGCLIALDVFLGIYWLAVVRDGWVRQQADEFSDQFFIVAELAARAATPDTSSPTSQARTEEGRGEVN